MEDEKPPTDHQAPQTPQEETISAADQTSALNREYPILADTSNHGVTGQLGHTDQTIQGRQAADDMPHQTEQGLVTAAPHGKTLTGLTDSGIHYAVTEIGAATVGSSLVCVDPAAEGWGSKVEDIVTVTDDLSEPYIQVRDARNTVRQVVRAHFRKVVALPNVGAGATPAAKPDA